MQITLYGSGTTRSARCRWALAEAGLDYELIERKGLIGSDEIKAIHPLGKLPAAVVDGRPLFESAAICTYVADKVPERGLVGAPGTWERALHDQWVQFNLSELEAWLWNTAVNSFVLPEAKRVTAQFAQNESMFRRSVMAIETHLDGREYLVGERLSVTDIIVGWTLNWGRRQGFLDDSPNTAAYVARLLEQPNCTLAAT